MAHHLPDGSEEHLWGAIALARALQRVSRYPLLLLSNASLPGCPDFARALAQLGVRVLPLEEVVVPGARPWVSERWDVAFWKLQVFKLTGYDKLIWLDADAMITRSMDWIFSLPGMHAQRDDWFCWGRQPALCSGMFSLIPNADHFHGMLDYAKKIGSMLTSGDQQLIQLYFRNVVKEPVQLLDDVDAAFGQCIGSANSSYLVGSSLPSGGIWNMPGFIHKSGGWGDTNNAYSNVCFQHNMSKQRYHIFEQRVVVNICHFHPAASHWRDMFCEANSILQAGVESVNMFCSDSCYYHGVHVNGTACELMEVSPPAGGQLKAIGQYGALSSIDSRRAHGLPEMEMDAKWANQQRHAATPQPLLLHSFDMSKWSCRGRCPNGGCCVREDCETQCAKRFGDECYSYLFNADTFQCNLYTKILPLWSNEGGSSGPDITDALAFPGAAMPETGFTIMARIHSSSEATCQDVVAWGDPGSWQSAELRIQDGNLLWGENPDTDPTPSKDLWTQVASKDLDLNNGEWQSVAVSRSRDGSVALYVNGCVVARATIATDIMKHVHGGAMSVRIAHSKDCVFNGNITQVRIYDKALTAQHIYGLAHACVS